MKQANILFVTFYHCLYIFIEQQWNQHIIVPNVIRFAYITIVTLHHR
jgi:hypothetical protein